MEEEPSQHDAPAAQSQAPTAGPGQSQGKSQGTGRAPMPMAMNMNRGFVTILKMVYAGVAILCMVLVVVAALLAILGYSGAEYFGDDERLVLVCPYDNTSTFIPDDGTACKLRNLTHRLNCFNRNNRLEARGEKRRPCLIDANLTSYGALILVVIGALLAVVLLALLLVLFLFSKGQSLLTMIVLFTIWAGIVIAGIILIVAAVLMLGYIGEVNQRETCDDKYIKIEYDINNQEDREYDFWTRFGPDAPKSPAQNTTSDGGKPKMGEAARSGTAAFKAYSDNCSNFENRLFKTGNFFYGAISSIVGALLCFLAPLCAAFSGKRAVRPMM